MEITIENYREYPAISYSTLAALDRDPKNLISKQEETEPMKLGNIVDILITNQKEFKEKYIVADIYYPSDNIKEIIERINISEDLRLEDCGDIIKAAAKEINYGQSWKPETVVEKVIKEGLAYFQFLQKAGDKEIITEEDLSKCTKLASKILTGEFTNSYFNTDKYLKNSETKYQLPLLSQFEDKYLIKSLLDKVIFNHEEKIIYPFDLKTMQESIYSFPSKFLKWRYDVQASLYTLQLKKNYPDYKIAPFRFIVGSFTDYKVMVFDASQYLEPAYTGYTDKYGRKIKGWKQLLEEYNWHIENQKFEYKKEVYDTNGEILLEMV